MLPAQGNFIDTDESGPERISQRLEHGKAVERRRQHIGARQTGAACTHRDQCRVERGLLGGSRRPCPAAEASDDHRQVLHCTTG